MFRGHTSNCKVGCWVMSKIRKWCPKKKKLTNLVKSTGLHQDTFWVEETVHKYILSILSLLSTSPFRFNMSHKPIPLYCLHFLTFLDTDGRIFLKASSKFSLLTLMSATGPEEYVWPVCNNEYTFMSTQHERRFCHVNVIVTIISQLAISRK